MQITEKSNKAEILSASCELIDTQAEKIEALQQQQQILVAISVTLFCWLILH